MREVTVGKQGVMERPTMFMLGHFTQLILRFLKTTVHLALIYINSILLSIF
jgi:hypothetical protein